MNDRFLIVNSAEPGITEFTRPLAGILESEAVKYRIIEYSDTIKTDIQTFRGVIISGSPRGNDMDQDRGSSGIRDLRSVENLPFYSFQFHPEVYNRRLVVNFVEMARNHL